MIEWTRRQAIMAQTKARDIPFNYTSADDRRVFAMLFGTDVLAALERLVFKRRTGRTWRLLMRFVGDLFIHHRNPFLYQELIDSKERRQQFLLAARRDLDMISGRGAQEPDLTIVVEQCRHKLNLLGKDLASTSQTRGRIQKTLGAIVGAEHLFFDPLSLIAHATDATDWRLHLPIAVVCPGEETQIPSLLKAIAGLKLHAIPRGGGTGLTGGAVPVAANCVVINTEKLNRILDAARLAPSGKNGQPWIFIILSDKETREKILHQNYTRIHS